MMNSTTDRVSTCFAGLALAAMVLLFGQTVSAQAVSPTPASAAPPATDPTKDETVELSPFVVNAEEDTGYAPKETLAGTRLRTEIKNVASSLT